MSGPNFEIIFNGEIRSVSQQQLNGMQLRSLFGIENSHTLVLEGVGDEPDRIIGDHDVVKLLQTPLRLFVHPPTMFGMSRL
jgi:hypothetical protein